MARGGRRSAAATLLALAGLAVAASIHAGAVPIPPGRIIVILRAAIASQTLPADVQRDALVLTQIRLPRVALGFLVGGSLGVSGALLQSLFRNPLADPGLVGVSAGAGLAAASAIVLGDRWLPRFADYSGVLLPATAFGGSLVATGFLYVLATRGGKTSVSTLLLAGVGLGALAGAVTGLLVFMSTDSQLRDLTFWLLGSLGGATWRKVLVSAATSAVLFAAIPFLGRSLNLLALGDGEAFHMGVRVQPLKRLLIGLVSLAVGSSVALAGPIAFVGIVVPHALRLAVASDNRFVLPASAILGGALLTTADVLARTVAAPADIPIGIITAAIGAPCFLALIVTRWRELAT